MTKLLLFLATQKGHEVLLRLHGLDPAKIGTVIGFDETGDADDYGAKIESFCAEAKIPFAKWTEVRGTLAALVAERGITEAVAIGWRYLIPLDMNAHLRNGLLIFHDSLLPRFRGFTPTVTAILCGETEIGMTVLFATDEVDRGGIVLQKRAGIDGSTYLRDAIAIQSRLYAEAAADLMPMLENGPLPSTPQDESKATYSIWRRPDDGLIDWSHSSDEIRNLVRAVGHPYFGAFSHVDGEMVKIVRAEVVDDVRFEVRDAGKIWRYDGPNPVVVCGTGMLAITEATDAEGRPFAFKGLRKKLS